MQVYIFRPYSRSCIFFLFIDIPKAGWDARSIDEEREKERNEAEKERLVHMYDLPYTRKMVKFGTIRLSAALLRNGEGSKQFYGFFSFFSNKSVIYRLNLNEIYYFYLFPRIYRKFKKNRD